MPDSGDNIQELVDELVALRREKCVEFDNNRKLLSLSEKLVRNGGAETATMEGIVATYRYMLLEHVRDCELCSAVSRGISDLVKAETGKHVEPWHDERYF